MDELDVWSLHLQLSMHIGIVTIYTDSDQSGNTGMSYLHTIIMKKTKWLCWQFI